MELNIPQSAVNRLQQLTAQIIDSAAEDGPLALACCITARAGGRVGMQVLTEELSRMFEFSDQELAAAAEETKLTDCLNQLGLRGTELPMLVPAADRAERLKQVEQLIDAIYRELAPHLLVATNQK